MRWFITAESCTQSAGHPKRIPGSFLKVGVGVALSREVKPTLAHLARSEDPGQEVGFTGLLVRGFACKPFLKYGLNF